MINNYDPNIETELEILGLPSLLVGFVRLLVRTLPGEGTVPEYH